MHSNSIVIKRSHFTILVVSLGLLLGIALAACTPPATPTVVGGGGLVYQWPNAACDAPCDPAADTCGAGMLCTTNDVTGESSCAAPWCPSYAGYYPPACGMTCSSDDYCAAGLACVNGRCTNDSCPPTTLPLDGCFDACDPADANSCLPGYHCQPNKEAGNSAGYGCYHSACEAGDSMGSQCVPQELGGNGCLGYDCVGAPGKGYYCWRESEVVCGESINCRTDEMCAPLGGEYACIDNKCESPVCAFVPENTGPTPTSAGVVCGDQGGVSFIGDVCVCPGVIDKVVICVDGTKYDNVTTTACTPTEPCPNSGGTTGGDQTCTLTVEQCNAQGFGQVDLATCTCYGNYKP